MGLFELVGDAVRSMTPDELGEVRYRWHRRGVKVWFDTAKPGREHYEAQLLPRRHVDGSEGMALEVGFHAEHRDLAANEAAVAALSEREKRWRKSLGGDADLGEFYGAENWRRLSEAWIEPDLDDPDLAFEVATRLVDFITVIEPLRH